jgi:uncharacterized protein
MFRESGNLIANHDSGARAFARQVSRVLWYDYRGYGFSSGKAHFDDLSADATRIYDATLAQSGHNEHIVVLGYSMGTTIAEYLAIRRQVAGLILAAPWSDLGAMLRYGDPKHEYRITPHAAADFDETAMVRRIRAPLLVFQGTNDDEIPPWQGHEVEKQGASPNKRFVAIDGAKHNGFENQQSLAVVTLFLEQLDRTQ